MTHILGLRNVDQGITEERSALPSVLPPSSPPPGLLSLGVYDITHLVCTVSTVKFVAQQSEGGREEVFVSFRELLAFQEMHVAG